MRVELIRRPEHSRTMVLLSPIIAIALTVIAGFFVFLAIGVDPLSPAGLRKTGAVLLEVYTGGIYAVDAPHGAAEGVERS